MKTIGLLAGLMIGLAGSPAHAKPGAVAMTCKPCGTPPLEMALNQAELMILGRLSSAETESQGKGQGGEARLKVRVLQWLKKPSRGRSKIKKTKGLTELRVKLTWDGACIPAPPPFEKGQRWVFFLNASPQTGGGSPGILWEGTPGHCSLKYADPTSPEGNLESLKARLGAR